MSQMKHHPYDNPESFNVFPELGDDIEGNHGDRQSEIAPKDDFVIVVIRWSKEGR